MRGLIGSVGKVVVGGAGGPGVAAFWTAVGSAGLISCGWALGHCHSLDKYLEPSHKWVPMTYRRCVKNGTIQFSHVFIGKTGTMLCKMGAQITIDSMSHGQAN